MVFLPSTRKGSLRVEMSNQTWLAGVLASRWALMFSPTMRAQSEMRPSTMVTSAP